MSRLAKSKPAKTNSFTALLLAPGVLNTAIPFSVQVLISMLLTPAPALQMAFNSGLYSISNKFALRTKIPSQDCTSSETL